MHSLPSLNLPDHQTTLQREYLCQFVEWFKTAVDEGRSATDWPLTHQCGGWSELNKLDLMEILSAMVAKRQTPLTSERRGETLNPTQVGALKELSERWMWNLEFATYEFHLALLPRVEAWGRHNERFVEAWDSSLRRHLSTWSDSQRSVYETEYQRCYEAMQRVRARHLHRLALSQSDPKSTELVGHPFLTRLPMYPSAPELVMARRLDPTGLHEICEGEVWTNFMRSWWDQRGRRGEISWPEMLRFAQTASASRASTAWLKDAKDRFFAKATAGEEFQALVFELLPRFEEGLAHPMAHHVALEVVPENAQVLKGLIWILGLFKDRTTAEALCSLTLHCYKKVPNLGARSVSLGNACIDSLSRMYTLDSLAKLAHLRTKIRYLAAQKAIETSLQKLADRLKISTSELEEMSLSCFGLETLGEGRETIGNWTAVTRVHDLHQTSLHWEAPSGAIRKSIPALLKETHPEACKEVAFQKKELDRMMPLLVERLDRVYLRKDPWSFEDWKQRYWDHPLMGVLARKLIWNFHFANHSAAAFYDGSAWTDAEGQGIELEAPERVSLWHPLHQPEGEVQAWREWMLKRRVVQPIQQAFREVFVPEGDPEARESKLFSGLVLKQYQFQALAPLRGWNSRLRSTFGSDLPVPSRSLREWNLRVEFRLQGHGTELEIDIMLRDGSYKWLLAGEVRFYQLKDPQATSYRDSHLNHFKKGKEEVLAQRLSDLPPRIYSEMMREVDKLVDASCIGHDPKWLDVEEQWKRQENWYQSSFGSLRGAGLMRKTFIEIVLPELKIGSKCKVMDPYLVVQGKLHEYKIHLGSANILMMPHETLLCFVPEKEPRNLQGVLLPFHHEPILRAVLAKAFLLVDDHKIQDPVIQRQLS